VRCHGIWDIDEFYDLQEDPLEGRNLIFSAQHRTLINQMRNRLFEILAQTDGQNMPIWPDRGAQSNLRNGAASKAADFPSELVRPAPPDRQ
jgi:N-acetylglucosamine-6-sulfatase